MKRMIRAILSGSAVFFILTLLGGQAVQAQNFEEPYSVDENTMLLLHFDGDTEAEQLENASDSTADAIAHGNVQFQQSPLGEEWGDVLYLDNNQETDSSYLAIPDTAALDLTESWTMEAWVNIFTYGETSNDWRWRPKLLVKPGVEAASNSNYYNVMRGDLRVFNTGFYSDQGGSWFDVRSPANSFQPLTWYHVTYIRDAEKNLAIQLIHDRDGELLYYTTGAYPPLTNDPPVTTDAPAYIGINLGQGGGWLDGYIDEMRISNVVREFEAPPSITGVPQLSNQPADQSAEVTADLHTIGDTQVESATLHYRTDPEGDGFEGAFQTASLSGTGEGTYSGTIPGQDVGSFVQFYISAEADNGLRNVAPRLAEDPDDPVYQSYAVVEPESQTLYLSFEEGADATDQSQYESPVEVVGNPEYVEGAPAAEGDRAIWLRDTTYLEIDTPHEAYLASEEFTLDFWMMAPDSVPSFGARVVIKESLPATTWNNFNYQIWTTGGGDVTAASFVPGCCRTGAAVGVDSTIVPDEWYRVKYVFQEDSSYSQLYNADNELIDENGGPMEGPPNLSSGPFRIGAHSGSEAVLGGDPYFHGMVDEVKFYNYAVEEGTPVEDPGSLPAQVSLEKNYPNPFNEKTAIEYQLSKAEHATLAVYDLLGRKVATLVDGTVTPGRHKVSLSASNLPSGIYFYRLETEAVTKVRKMIVVK